MTTVLARAVLAVALMTGGTLAAAAPAQAATPTYRNCTAMHKTYKHGVGRKGAKDKVRPGNRPVTNFKVSTPIYNKNKKLDRDKDGVACEKR